MGEENSGLGFGWIILLGIVAIGIIVFMVTGDGGWPAGYAAGFSDGAKVYNNVGSWGPLFRPSPPDGKSSGYVAGYKAGVDTALKGPSKSAN